MKASTQLRLAMLGCDLAFMLGLWLVVSIATDHPIRACGGVFLAFMAGLVAGALPSEKS